MDKAIGKQNRVFIISSFPCHERNEHILPERELTAIGRGTVCEHAAPRNTIAARNDRTLIQ